ncbi:hypothetical protein [Aeromicrobium sp.]|nr:hypothetical protein [Aeromicrobium sp.]MBC7631949.1 hypothetical protein [Aeromicrobium sp.]
MRSQSTWEIFASAVLTTATDSERRLPSGHPAALVVMSCPAAAPFVVRGR